MNRDDFMKSIKAGLRESISGRLSVKWINKADEYWVEGEARQGIGCAERECQIWEIGDVPAVTTLMGQVPIGGLGVRVRMRVFCLLRYLLYILPK